MFFETPDALSGSDTDTAVDIYVNESSALTLVSPGSQNVIASFATVTDDGRAFFTSFEPLAGGDTDSASDVYQSALGVAPTTPPDDAPARPPRLPTPRPTTGSAKAAKQKNDGTVEVTVTCGAAEACIASRQRHPDRPDGRGARGKRPSAHARRPTVPPAGTATLVLKVPKKGKKAAAAALKAGKKVKGTVTVVLTDAAGNAATLRP